MGLQTAGLCYAQPLNNGLFTVGEYSFETSHFCHASAKFTCLLEILAELRLPFGEIGVNFPVQLS